MTQNDEGPDSPAGQSVLTVRTSSVGEVLANRYRLEEHINDDAHGRQVWRGIDVVLRRPIALVLRHPGGPTAEEMLTGAVAASRIIHPHLVDVYDAVDEGTRAYVVREWVDGTSLRELVSEGPLDSVRATSIAHAIASAIAAAHATGMVHGNVHPGTVLVADDGRVMLADARYDESASAEGDVRAVGAVLYCSLTGHWPHAEAGFDRLQDAVRDPAGTLASPRQVRGGLPSYLSELATGLLDLSVDPPSAEHLASDLSRLDTDANDEFYGDGPLGFAAIGTSRDRSPRGRTGRKIVIGAVALLVIAAGGILLATNVGGANAQTPPATISPTSAGTSTTSSRPSTPASNAPAGSAANVPLTASSVQMVETGGDGDSAKELDGSAKTVDGDESTGWKSEWYTTSTFGNLKSGMGLLIDLKSVKTVTSVKVDFLTPGATAQVLVGNTYPGPGFNNTKKMVSSFTAIGTDGPQVVGATRVFPIGSQARYVLIWVTAMPSSGSYGPKGRFLFGINEVAVSAQ